MFRDRQEAGRRLAAALHGYRGKDVVVLGLPRGGVPVAVEVARELGAPLDVIIVRKLGVPFHRELAMGAIGEGGVLARNDEVIGLEGVTAEQLAEAEVRERAELARRAEQFRGDRPRLDLSGRTAILVDDGIATGSTAAAACAVARSLGARRVVLAVPVGARDSIDHLRRVADEVVCLETPEPFYAVGQWYRDFSETTDEQVVAALHRSAGGAALGREVVVGARELPGSLTVPAGSRGLVLFAHGSGSSRHSPRNRWVAEVLNDAGFATLLFDLLHAPEQDDRAKVFDIELLGGRLADATRSIATDGAVAGLPLGYFGASTGAAAALWAATEPGIAVDAVVSRGGRPDLAAERLPLVTAPTLLVVGGLDTEVLELNRLAAARLRAETRIEVVPGATHLFEEPGTLASAADLASGWFTRHLAGHPRRTAVTFGPTC